MKIAQSPEGFSAQQWAQFAELGVIGALFDEADGGYGGAGFDIAVVFEALGRGLVVEPFLPSAILAGSALALAGNAAQKALLAGIIDGTRVATLAHGEPASHHELARVHTRAVRDAQGGWVLDGHKAVVALAEQAQVLIVSARTSGADDADEGISLFTVPAHTPGLTMLGYPLIDGGRAADVTLAQVKLPADALLGAEGQALPTLEHAIGRGLLALCAESLGAMEVAKQATIAYLQTRQQFGVPIGSFQALQHRMATLLLEIEQARSAVINAAAALDADERLTRERALSAAKFSIGRIGTLVAEECIQLHGGIGMTWELPLSHYAKRLIMIDHQLGDEDHHLARFIALGQH
jgi:alkylation response protein AidB-like acyl-CoA dehydrogenase